MSVKNLLGQTFGRLIVIEYIGVQKRNAMWKCRCDCGNKVIVRGTSLTRNNTQSCGCLQRDRAREANLKDVGVAAYNAYYNAYQRGAQNRHLSFQLSLSEFKRLTQSCCHYCGIQPQTIFPKGSNNGKLNGNIIVNGIDRKDNALGYQIDNCVPCCHQCNFAKRKQSYKDFLQWIERLKQHSIPRGNE